MAYFSNGTEGDRFEARFCRRCAHGGGEEYCPVMWLHELWNGAQFPEHAETSEKRAAAAVRRDFLETLITSSGDPAEVRCRMFSASSREAAP